MTNVFNDTDDAIKDISDPLQVLNGFYRQIILVKHSIENKNIEIEVSQYLKVDRIPTRDEVAEVVSIRLQRWLERVRKDAQKTLTEKEFLRINEAIYVAAVLADELFILEIDWGGKDYWHAALLEEKLFQSSYAGERFYQNIVVLLNEQVLDPQQQGLLAVYFLAIRLGFEGRYRGDSKRLEIVRKRLFKRINGSMDSQPKVIFRQAYSHPFISLREYRLAPLDRWKKNMAQLFIVYLVMGWFAWVALKGTWAIAT